MLQGADPLLLAPAEISVTLFILFVKPGNLGLVGTHTQASSHPARNYCEVLGWWFFFRWGVGGGALFYVCLVCNFFVCLFGWIVGLCFFTFFSSSLIIYCLILLPCLPISSS